MSVRITSVSVLPILGYPRNLKGYLGWRMREARLVIKDGKAFLKVVFERPLDNVEARDSVAVDINMAEVVVGKDDSDYVRIPTRLGEVHRWRSLAVGLQRRYPGRWRENRGILHRICCFHLRARRIMEDSAWKVGKWIVDVAVRLGANVVKLEGLKSLIESVGKPPKEYRGRLYLMQYRGLQYWIGWQARKHGLTVEFVNPSYSSTSYPKCGHKMVETGHRYFHCPSCGYGNDRDVLAITNLSGWGSLTPRPPPR